MCKLAVMMGRGITGPYKISCFSPGVSLVKSMVVALCILVSAPSAQAGPMPPFSDLAGHTLFGATVESGAVWSVYLGHDGRAEFSYASGNTGTARWRAADKEVICFAFDDSGEETCKRGSAYGIGSGWSTVYPREDGGWRPYQEDPHGSSRIFAAWPGHHRHNPASFTGDLRDSLPGRLYVDDPGTGVFAVEVRPDGTGALLSSRGVHQIEETEYGARHICIDEECAELRIEHDRLRLYKRGNDRSEGNLIYLALGRYDTPAAPKPKDTPEPAPSTDTVAEAPSAEVPPEGEDCGGSIFGGADAACVDAKISAAREEALAAAGWKPAQPVESAPEMDKREIEYPWFGRYDDIPTRNVKTWDLRDPVRVDFENGSPRIGGRVLVPGFEPDAARIVAVTESYALIRYSDPMLPNGCAEAYRWLWVTESDYGLMSPPFGACTEAEEVELTWQGAKLLATMTPEAGVASTFSIFPSRKDGRNPLGVSVTSGPSIDFAPLDEEDWKAIEHRQQAERLAAEEEQKAEERRQAREEAAQQRAAEMDAKRRPATPAGRLDGGNVFDILAQDAVQSALLASENGNALRDVFTQHFTTATYLPENRRVGDVYMGLACGPDGCRELQVMVFYDAGTGAAFGAVSAGFSSSATFGSEGWLEEKEELLTPDLNEMMEEMGKEMAAEAVSDYKTR